MKLRRFVGATMTAAVARVKEALGPDAVILETRSLAGENGLVEVMAAVDDASPGATGASADADLAAEVRELARLVRDLVARERAERSAALGPGLGALYESLLAQGVNGGIVASLIEETAARMAGGVALRGAVVGAVGSALDFGPGPVQPPAGAAATPRVRVFFGPAGEGKTTTIAKLAGEAVVRRGRRAAVISADTYRVGGTHELAAYGRVLGVPFAAVADGAELARAVKSFAGVEEILVDTGGITAGDPQQLAEVAALCEALGGSAAGDGVGRTLVVSATAAPAVARRVWHALRALHPDSCIVTKVDEAAAVGVLEVLWRQRLPLTFFGTGRRVPHDLERASPERVAAGLVAA